MRKLLMLLALVLSLTATATAQLQQVVGYVYDETDGEPIIGATVRIDGSKKATVTDLDGKFTFSNLKATEKKVTITYVGYEPKTVKLEPMMKVYIESNAAALDEIIVVAFGKQKRESFTGSASVVKADEIQRSQSSNPIDALNGKVTGMQMTETNSVCEDPSVTIRGIGSINAGTEPLYIVDGLPYNGYLTDLNPADIENITVLKDAASNALYGARGANGVIMVTTKRAQRGATRVTLDAKWGVNTNGRIAYDVIDNPGEYYEAQYVLMKNYYMYTMGQTADAAHIAANQNIGGSTSGGGLGYMVYTVPDGQYLIGSNGKLNPNAVLGARKAYENQIYTLYPDDWSKEGMRNGFRQEYNINVSGGNENYSIMATLGYLHNEGLAYNNGYDRVTARIKTTYKAYDWLNLGVNGGYTYGDFKNMGSVYGLKYTMAPIYPLYIRDEYGNIMHDRNGKMYDYGYLTNAGCSRAVDEEYNAVQTDLLDMSKSGSNAFSIQGYADFTWRDFTLTVNGSIYDTEVRMNASTNPYYGFPKTYGGYLWTGHYRTMDTNYQQLLQYHKDLGNNNFDVLVGHEYSRTVNTLLEGDKTSVADYKQNIELDGAIINSSIKGSKSLYNVEGWFGRINYDYDNRYFASFSYRRDGSSVFHPKHRWGNFWSAGAAWLINKEEWFPKSDKINELKFKVSYGEQGNDGIDEFLYTNTYSISNANDEVAYVFSRHGNENITWEKAGSLNLGFEFALFNNRFSGELVYYNRSTFDMLMSITCPASLGYTSYYDNLGNMSNQGVEFNFDATLVKTKNFSWDLGGNLTWQRNRITKLPEERKGYTMDGHEGYFSDTHFYGEGLPIYTWYLKKYAGVNDEGYPTFYMQDENTGELSTTTEYSNASYFLCGNPLPDVFGGFNTTFKLFDFDLTANFNYSIGGKKLNVGYKGLISNPAVDYPGGGIHRDFWKAWTPENHDSTLPMRMLGMQFTSSNSDYFLTNASYLTFKSLTLGYNFPKSVTNALRMTKFRLYCTCENLWYWTAMKGFDPRMFKTQGSELTSSPAMRTFTAGLQVSF